MISQGTIDRVMETARVEEVVGDFVSLKKRGANFIGHCPFHNEKTPSFTVTPHKGIYKCFGCGAAGNAVGFLMEHEHLSYPDAIRALAARYNIAVEEETRELSETHKQELSERDRMYQLHAFAQTYFHMMLTENDEGKAIGLSYFRERGITDESIEKFGLGYSPDAYEAFSNFAKTSDFGDEILTESGLSIRTSRGSLIDRFRGRVIFPFYNLSGKVIGFGGRILTNNKKEAKYLNSPETLLYKKSETLYGLFQAKKAVQKADNCYLVEGYTDVIGLHQAGIENVAASSGTSLTQEQARLMRRFSKKVTVIYDGDFAGIKASMRGINILLEHDLQVAVVPLPEGEDPDSYSRQLGPEEFKQYLAAHTVDFVQFKVDLLLTEAGADPLKRAEVIHDLAETISYISDPIVRTTYSSSTAGMLGITETVFLQAVNQHLLNRHKRQRPDERTSIEALPLAPAESEPQAPVLNDEPQETDIVRILLHHAEDAYDEEQSVVAFVTGMLDEIVWDSPICEAIFRMYEADYKNEQKVTDRNQLFNHPNKALAAKALEVYSKDYQLSANWEVRHEILVPSTQMRLTADVRNAVIRLSLKKVIGMMRQCMEKMKAADLQAEALDALLAEYAELKSVHRELAQELGTSISH